MPRYFFHVVDDVKVYPDTEGVDLPGLGAAWDYALEDARDLVDKRIIPPARAARCRIDILDEDGERLGTVPVDGG